MSLARGMEDKKYDKRILEWNLRNGVISKEEYEQYLASMKDESDRAIEMKVFAENSQSGDFQ